MVAVNRLGFIFFVLALTAVWYRTSRRQRWKVMLAASIMFYLLLDAAGFPVLAAAAWAVWQCALRLKKSVQHKKQWLLLGGICALVPLALKYYRSAAMMLGRVTGRPFWDGSGLLVPLGLAYFTLQLAGYLFDVHAEKIEPEQSFARVLCYGTFFLSITQGPFNHYGDLMSQLDATPAFDTQRLWSGSIRMAWGYFKKIVVTEQLASVVDRIFGEPANYDSSILLFAACLFALQLYADFSGYTDIVLGVGETLGLTLPENFRQPFLARTVSEYWKRWHISFSSWLRVYIYIPLGGNRRGNARMVFNLLITFLVSGIWHGSGFNFIAWGLLNGLYQIVGKCTGKWRKKIWDRAGLSPEHPVRRACQTAFVFCILTFAYVFFRCGSFTDALIYLSCIVRRPGLGLMQYAADMLDVDSWRRLGVAAFVLIAVDIVHEKGISIRQWLLDRPLPVRWILYEAAIYSFVFLGNFASSSGFMYERF